MTSILASLGLSREAIARMAKVAPVKPKAAPQRRRVLGGYRPGSGRPRTIWRRTDEPFRWPAHGNFGAAAEWIVRSKPGTLLDAADSPAGWEATRDAMRRLHRQGYVVPDHTVKPRSKP